MYADHFIEQVIRKQGVLALNTFYFDLLGFSGYGVPRKDSAEARSIGGRVPEAHHYQ
jgi:hypothetical protein